MFCPKCGTQNPENGKFCRSCGTDLGNVSTALASAPAAKCKTPSWEGAITKMATGLAFLAIAIVLAVTNIAGGRVWWFWMLIPSFTMIGSAIAQFVQIKKNESAGIPSGQAARSIPAAQAAQPLPPQSVSFTGPEGRYKTGDLVPNSVTDSTTRHLEAKSEDRTMNLPRRTDPL